MFSINKNGILGAVLVAAVSLGSISPAFAMGYGNNCKAVIDSEIAKLDIPKERIKDVFTVDIFAGGGESGGARLERVEGWVKFNDCKGNLVVDLDAFCRPQGSYTTYECQVPGVKHY
ncbi:MAG: hypothetical protein NXI13_09505 [Proteobacteria bacterium]|nr:hypothetical protein [Pseudomonadota bacterium]